MGGRGLRANTAKCLQLLNLGGGYMYGHSLYYIFSTFLGVTISVITGWRDKEAFPGLGLTGIRRLGPSWTGSCPPLFHIWVQERWSHSLRGPHTCLTFYLCDLRVP